MLRIDTVIVLITQLLILEPIDIVWIKIWRPKRSRCLFGRKTLFNCLNVLCIFFVVAWLWSTISPSVSVIYVSLDWLTTTTKPLLLLLLLLPAYCSLTVGARAGTHHLADARHQRQVDGQKYSGQGRSKKSARLIAAELALRNFIQLKDGAVLTPIIKSVSSNNVDFTSDELELENGTAASNGMLKTIFKVLYYIICEMQAPGTMKYKIHMDNTTSKSKPLFDPIRPDVVGLWFIQSILYTLNIHLHAHIVTLLYISSQWAHNHTKVFVPGREETEHWACSVTGFISLYTFLYFWSPCCREVFD